MVKIDEIMGNDFSGVVSISKNGKSIFKSAYGYADLPNERRNKVDTKFGTASAGKAFIAVAIMKLIEEGKLRFDSCIGNILDFDLKQVSKKVNITQLLNHTSGIPDYFDESIMEEYAELWADFPNYRIRTSADLIPLFINKPMMYEPGEKFQYNNTGYVVLGLIIESITRVPFDEFLSNAIFKPCGMGNTGYYELDRLPANCANAYILDERRNEYYTNIYSVDVKGTGAGGAFTTVDDIESFWMQIGNVVSKQSVSKMLSSQVESGEYGYGFWLRTSDGKEPYPYFQGSDPGVSFISSFDNAGLFIAITSNFGNNVWRIHRELRDLFCVD